MHPGISFAPLYLGLFMVHTLFTQSILKVVSPCGNFIFAAQVAVQTVGVHFIVLDAGAFV